MGRTATAHTCYSSNNLWEICHPYGVLGLFLREYYNHFTPSEFASATRAWNKDLPLKASNTEQRRARRFTERALRSSLQLNLVKGRCR